MSLISNDYEKAIRKIALSKGGDNTLAFAKLRDVCTYRLSRIKKDSPEYMLITAFINDINVLLTNPNPTSPVKRLNELHDRTISFLEAHEAELKSGKHFRPAVAGFIEKLYSVELVNIHNPERSLIKNYAKEEGSSALQDLMKKKLQSSTQSSSLKSKAEELVNARKLLSEFQGDDFMQNLATMGHVGIILSPIKKAMDSDEEEKKNDFSATGLKKTITEAMTKKGTEVIKKKAEKFLETKLGDAYAKAKSESEGSAEAIKEELKQFTQVIKKHLLNATEMTGRNYISKEGETVTSAYALDFNETLEAIYNDLVQINSTNPLEALKAMNSLNKLLALVNQILIVYKPHEADGDMRSLLQIALEGNEHVYAMFSSAVGVLEQLRVPSIKAENKGNEYILNYVDAVSELRANAVVLKGALNRIPPEAIASTPQASSSGSSWFNSFTSMVTGTVKMVSNVASEVKSLASLASGKALGALNFLRKNRENFTNALHYQDQLVTQVERLVGKLEGMMSQKKNMVKVLMPIIDKINVNAAQRAGSLFHRYFKQFADDKGNLMKMTSQEDRNHFGMNTVSLMHNIAELCESLPEVIRLLIEQGDFLAVDEVLAECINDIVNTLNEIQEALIPDANFLTEGSEHLCGTLEELCPAINQTVSADNERVPEYMHNRKPAEILREDMKVVTTALQQIIEVKDKFKEELSSAELTARPPSPGFR